MGYTEYSEKKNQHHSTNESNENVTEEEDASSAKQSPSIVWRQLTFTVNTFQRWKLCKRPILRQLSGHFASGTLNSLLGPSGAGKTTLLNCLAGNQTSGLTTRSQIYFLNTKATTSSYFIAQHVHENILAELTVEQILSYAFQFKNDSANSQVMHSHINQIMSTLLLPPELQSRPFGKCSGGEQKRVAIAQELMSLQAPTFLFIDEPTTGLDSAAAFEVMSCLKSLATQQAITIITSIHAPNDETLNLFDKLYILAKGGLAIYSGPPGQIRDTLKEHLGRSIPPKQPPIEVLLKLACNGPSSEEVIKLAQHTLSVEANSSAVDLTKLNYQPEGLPRQRAAFSLRHLLIELRRHSASTIIANYQTLLILPFIFTLYFTILTSIFSSDMTSSSGCVREDNSTCLSATGQLEVEGNVRENFYFLCFTLIFVGFMMLVRTTMHFGQRLKIFQCEHRNGWYSLNVFYWSTTLIAFLELNLIVLFVTVLSYFLSNQQAADGGYINLPRLGLYLLYLWLLCLYNQSIGHLIGIVMLRHLHYSILGCEMFFAATSLFNGVFVKIDRAPSVGVLEPLTKAIGMIHITRGMLYSIYGFDRCHGEGSFSPILIDNSADEGRIGERIVRVLCTVLVLRLLTLVLMMVQFCEPQRWWTLRRRQRNRLENQREELAIEDLKEATRVEMVDLQLNDRTTEKVQSFAEFSKNKIIIAWRDLTLFGASSWWKLPAEDDDDAEKRTILRSLNGQFCFGTLNGLMGTSGAGKTSLLKVLNGRCKTRLSEETSIYLSKYTAIHSCFITQEVSGHLMPGLTAHQTLYYASRLKNTQTDVDHEAIARRWLQELDLLNTANTKVEHCSGGERKRLAVALELTSLVMPNLICIDEPTSGLDTNSAEIVITSLHQLAHTHPICIITSIHQPTAEILEKFNQLYILARGGVCIYSGPPTQLDQYLTHLGPSIDTISQTKSPFPIEQLIKYSCSDYHHPIIKQLNQLNSQQYYCQNSGKELILTELQHVPDGVRRNRQRLTAHSCTVLAARFLAYICGHLWVELLFTCLVYLGYACSLMVFYKPDIIYASGCLNPEDDYNNSCTWTREMVEEQLLLADNICYVYFFTNLYLFVLVLSASFNFYREFKYFINEHRNGWYSSSAFYCVKSLFEIVPLLPLNLLYVYLVDIYAPVVPIGTYWPLVGILTLAAIAIQGMAHVFSLLGDGDLALQSTVLIGVYMLNLFLGNFYVPYGRLHYVYQMLSICSISRFVWEATLLLLYGFGRCRPNEFSSILYPMGIDDGYYSFAIGMIIFNCILYRTVALFLLIWRMNPPQNQRKRSSRISQYSEAMQGDGGGSCARRQSIYDII